MTPFKKWLQEIHRRSLWQVAGVYLAGSWVVLQVVDILVDSLALPQGLPALAILLMLLGLPVVLATTLFQGGNPLRKVLREIHRGHVWQALGVYLAGSWVALELIDILVDSLAWPSWLPALAFILILAGLPVVSVARVFGGRHGEPGEAEVEPGLSLAAAPAELEGSDRPAVTGGPGRFFTWRNAITGGLAAFAVWGVVATVWLLALDAAGIGRSEEAFEFQPDVVAVFPFRFVGPPELAFLGEGMVDLLAAKLTGEGGPRAADPRTVMNAWHRAGPSQHDAVEKEGALALGRALGAGQVLLGDIVGTPSGLILHASVYDGWEGRLRAQASVEGPPDSLTSMIDRLTVQLLALEAGEEDHRLSELTSQSLPALQAYLAGQTAYRQGEYSEADQHFQRALGIDSTFALAALGWVSSSWWAAGYERFNRARAVAWALREQLSPRDRTLLEAWAGPRYPGVSSWAEHLRMWELAIEAAPERPEPWWESGDIYLHYGPLLGVSDWRDRAAARFRRASQLDSSFVAPVGHLLELAALEGDTEEIRSLAAAYAAVDSAGDTSGFLQWRAASALGDGTTLAAVRSRFPQMASTSLSRILNLSQLYGTTLEDANLAAGNLAGRVGTRVERWEWLMGLHALARNKGRSHEAQQWLDEWAEVEGSPGESQRIRVLDGLFWDGDPIASARAVGMLEERAAARRGGEGELLGGELEDICVAEVWRLRHEDTHYTQEILEDLRTPSAEVGLGPLPLTHEVCAATIEALWFISEERTNAEATVARLDSLLLLGPYVETGDDVALIGNFIVAEWRESQGNLAGALAAMRRWHHHSLTGVRYLSTYLREEGRLATLTGDRDGAIRAYRHYLALRTDPEPDLKGEVDRIRVELERLLANN